MEVFLASITECIKIAIESFYPHRLPAVIIYNADTKRMVAEPVDRFISRRANMSDSTRILLHIDHKFVEAAIRMPTSAIENVVDI